MEFADIESSSDDSELDFDDEEQIIKEENNQEGSDNGSESEDEPEKKWDKKENISSSPEINKESESSESEGENESEVKDERANNLSQEHSMEELLKLREKIGTKKFNQVYFGNKAKQEKITNTNERAKKISKRSSKNHPQEISSKQKWRSHKIIPKNSRTRDPRFDEVSGSKFNSKQFDKQYSFLYDMQDQEIDKLKKEMKKKKGHKKEELKSLLMRLQNRQNARKRKQEDQEIVDQWRKQENDKVVKGKKPYFLKKSEVKKLINEQRMNKMKEQGTFEKSEKRKEKKISGKGKRKLPERRF